MTDLLSCNIDIESDPIVYDVSIDSITEIFDLDLETMQADSSIFYDVDVQSDPIVYDISMDSMSEVYALGMETRIQIAPSVVYDGDYVVEPSAHDDIVLPTAGYVMAEDVKVLQIKTYETHNDYGTTFYIAD